jgi:YHS domain-containing protein
MRPDLVCGKEVSEDTRYFSDYGGSMYHFCSPECKRKFDDHPDHFIRVQAKEQLGI